jgi:photosystem II stability/assembly factor-like uncharacterized protein
MRFWVGTRKGLFSIEKQGARWQIESRGFLGVPVTMTLFDQRTESWFAGVKHGHFGPKVHRSSDAGKTWTELAAPKFPDKPEDPDDKNPWSLMEIWSLEAGNSEQKGRLWCGTIPGGLFVSNDDGNTWELVRTLWDRPERKKWFGGGADQPGIHSIWIHPDHEDQIGLGVSCAGVWRSDDDGKTWRQSAHGMRAEFMPPELQFDPEIQDPHRIVQCPTAPNVLWAQHHNGIFRSVDGGTKWTEIEKVAPSAFGFGVVVHPKDPDSAWFIPAVKDELRYAVDGKVVVTRTRDGGKTFDVLKNGLPQEHAYDLFYRHALDIDATGDCIAFGSTTGSVFVTEDGGDSFREITSHLPPIYSVRFE